MSKPVAIRGWVCALCIVPLLAIIAVAAFVLHPAGRQNAARSSAPAAQNRIRAEYASLPLAFEKNEGQTDAQVKYMARGNGYVLFLTANDAVFALRSQAGASDTPAVSKAAVQRAQRRGQNPKRNNAQKDSTAVVHMQLNGGSALARVSASDEMAGKSNYFVGNDPKQWHADVPHYARVSYHDVYPGVNLAFHGAQSQTEFDFVVAPEANAAPIGFHFSGAQAIKTDDSGNLIVASAAGNIFLHKPVAYQERDGARQPVEAKFALKADNQVGFELGAYDHSRELVIDPSVTYSYSTYLGGSNDDEGYGIGFDGSGAAYVTGQTASANFPGASNSLAGTANAFVAKVASDGSGLTYSTYVGGSGNPGDSGNAIAVDASGDVFVAGGTTSSDFPHTGGVFQTTLNGTSNGFVFELSPTGAMTYSTYLGGSGLDTALGIALASDGSGDVFVVGKATSQDFPTLNPIQGFLTGSVASGFVTKLNATGTALVYSTYLGGSTTGDLTGAVAVDSSDNAYVTGQTFSATFSTTGGAFQTTCGSCTAGNSNAFVSVINAGGSAFVYSTFLGGNAVDAGDGIAVDSTGAYVTGLASSSNFPTTAGVLQTTYAGGTDAFVTKLNPAGSSLVYSTFLGGTQFDTGASVAVDGNGNAYITGQTSSTHFTTVNPTQATIGGGTDAFVSEINATGTQLLFSTFLGGSMDEDDGGNYGAIAVDSAGANIYVTGNTAFDGFPHDYGSIANHGGRRCGQQRRVCGQVHAVVHGFYDFFADGNGAEPVFGESG